MKHDATVMLNDKDAYAFARRLEKAIQRLSSKLSTSKAGALIQVWMPEMCSSGRVLLSTEGLPYSISGVGDLLALFRCISCKYRFDSDPSYGESTGAIGRVFYYGKPEMCIDVQQYDRSTYLRINAAHACRIHSTLILPVFSEDDSKASAVVEVSHHAKSVEFGDVVQPFLESLEEVGLRSADIHLDNLKLGLRKWPIEVCSVPLSSIEESNLPKKHPDEQDISNQQLLDEARQTGFGHVSDFLMNMGMDSLMIDDQSVNGYFNDTCSGFQSQNNCSDENNRMETDEANAFPAVISRCVSESGSANTTQTPEMHSHDSAIPNAENVCQATVPMADEAVCDIHSDSPKQEESRSDDKKDDDDGNTEAKKKENRLGGGAGKRLTYRDLEAHFGHGLKDAARRLGICPTTLKRACRRNGITRWPSRQISKLLKVWKQMGYKGEPPSWLLQNAISGNLRSENLAYILNAGLHVGLNPQKCDCAKSATFRHKHGHLSLFCSGHTPDPDGSLMMDDDLGFKNLTHHGAFTAALHGTDDDTFGFQEEQGSGHNHTWHAGQMANVVLHPSSFACQTTAAIPSKSMTFSSEMGQNKRRDDPSPTVFDLERTQRGGAGMIPILSEFTTPIDTEDVLMQPFHLPLGYEVSQNLFH